MMRPAIAGTNAGAAPSADRARVVFFCEDERGFDFGNPSEAFYIVDRDQHLLGALQWGTWFSADLSPGQHEFFEWAPYEPKLFGSSVDGAMKAYLEAGRTYYVQLTARPHPFYQTAVIPRFVPVSEAGPVAAARLRPLVTDPTAANAWAADHGGALRSHIADGLRKVSGGEFSTLGGPEPAARPGTDR